MPTAVSAPLYRLRGKIGRGEKVLELVEGRHSIGSSRKAHLHLPYTGVSRHHAELEVTREALRVRDLGSTNGTLVNGVRVQGEAAVPMGAELRLGPVRLRAEAIALEHQLAIALEHSFLSIESSTVLSVLDGDQSTLFLGRDASGQAALWLACVEEFLEQLRTTPGDDLGPALDLLGRSLLASGCCVVQWTEDDEPLALGSWGDLHECPSATEALRVTSGKDGVGAGFFDTEPPLSIAVSTRAGRAALGLLIWGDFSSRLSSRGLLQVLLRIVEHRRHSPVVEDPLEPVRSAQHPDLVFPPGYRPGTSPAMTVLFTQMRAFLRDMPVLLNGETGVGKEMMARILHDSSSRQHGPFIAINCAALPAGLLEAEMFGIEKYVATGVEPRPGKFQLADGGTLFLDEIGEMPPAFQAALLRALQEKEIQPVGGRPRPINVRVIAATNVDLAQHMREGKLRPDLFHRLGTVLEVPPLRACADDIPGLVEHFLRRFAGEIGVRIRGLTVRAMQILSSYDWPGNVRELEHVIRRVVCMSADGEIIDAKHLPRWLREKPAAHPSPEREPLTMKPPVEGIEKALILEAARRTNGVTPEKLAGAAGAQSLAELAELASVKMKPLVANIERALITEAARRTGGVKIEMCKLLGLSRNGLDRLLKRYGIQLEPFQRKS